MSSEGDVKHSNEEKGKLATKHVVFLGDIRNNSNAVQLNSTLTLDTLVCIDGFS